MSAKMMATRVPSTTPKLATADNGIIIKKMNKTKYLFLKVFQTKENKRGRDRSPSTKKKQHIKRGIVLKNQKKRRPYYVYTKKKCNKKHILIIDIFLIKNCFRLNDYIYNKIYCYLHSTKDTLAAPAPKQRETINGSKDNINNAETKKAKAKIKPSNLIRIFFRISSPANNCNIKILNFVPKK